ncbi:MAG: toll/interleukin-1 receptor domain-containing protein [Leptolyngbyaceae cyanobacterium]
MATEEHLEILKQGVEVWNRWRKENPRIIPDLRDVCLRGANLYLADFSGSQLQGANLSGAQLNSAYLSGAQLDTVNLSEANLSNASLEGATLREAILSGVNLSNATLNSATLRGARLDNANLRGADLDDVNLRRVTLHGADLSEVILGYTVLADLDLSNVKGLETFFHYAPSILDHRTLAKSGQLPLSFLRGVGLPDTYIDYIPSLFNQPLQFYSCFISYSSKDQEFAERLYADLQNKGVRCWYAPEDLPIGAKIRDGIDEAICRYDKLLLILSENSVNSQWVEQEVETALEKERERNNQIVLFPVRLDNAVMDSGDGWTRLIKNTRNIGDFCQWKDHDTYQKTFERLVKALKASLIVKD